MWAKFLKGTGLRGRSVQAGETVDLDESEFRLLSAQKQCVATEDPDPYVKSAKPTRKRSPKKKAEKDE